MKHLTPGLLYGEVCCIDHNDEPAREYSSPSSPSNLLYARTHAELAGRTDPPLSAGVSFTEKLVTDDYWNWA